MGDKMKRVGILLADLIAERFGTWAFIIYFGFGIAFWILWNTISTTQTVHFDPFPFIFLNLALSCLASIQAPIVLMSNSRQMEKDRKLQLEDIKKAQEVKVKLEEVRQELEEIKKEIRNKLH